MTHAITFLLFIATEMRPLEKFEANCTVLLVTSDAEQEQKENLHLRQVEKIQQKQQEQQHYDISLSAFSDIYNEYLSDHSEIETASTSDTDSSSSSTSLSNPAATISALKENYERSNQVKSKPPDIRTNIHNNQLFGVQIEVNFLLVSLCMHVMAVSNCHKLFS